MNLICNPRFIVEPLSVTAIRFCKRSNKVNIFISTLAKKDGGDGERISCEPRIRQKLRNLKNKLVNSVKNGTLPTSSITKMAARGCLEVPRLPAVHSGPATRHPPSIFSNALMKMSTLLYLHSKKTNGGWRVAGPL